MLKLVICKTLLSQENSILILFGKALSATYSLLVRKSFKNSKDINNALWSHLALSDICQTVVEIFISDVLANLGTILCTVLVLSKLFSFGLLALSAYLDDGFEDRILDGEKRSLKVLRLHPSIAPIKVIILTKDVSSEEQSDLADRLCKEVKIAGKSN